MTCQRTMISNLKYKKTFCHKEHHKDAKYRNALFYYWIDIESRKNQTKLYKATNLI